MMSMYQQIDLDGLFGQYRHKGSPTGLKHLIKLYGLIEEYTYCYY